MVAKLHTGEVGAPPCLHKESGKSQESFTVCPSVCRLSILLLGHVSNSDPDGYSNISATNFTPSHSSCRSRRRTNSKDTTMKLHSARCCESTSFTMQKAASGMSTQFPATPPELNREKMKDRERDKKEEKQKRRQRSSFLPECSHPLTLTCCQLHCRRLSAAPHSTLSDECVR